MVQALRSRNGPTQAQLDYDCAAAFYDETRNASPALVEAILEQLGPAAGRSLLEVGCGTGNYSRAFADAGFRVVGIDTSAEMLGRAAQKIPGRMGVAVARHLPFPNRSFDCVVTVNVYHHLPYPFAAFREFQRVSRDCSVHYLTAGEQFRTHWALHYFPRERLSLPGEHPTQAQLISLMQGVGFPEAAAVRFDYTDMADASFMALRHAPDRLVDSQHRLGISCYRRLSAAEHAAGESALAADLASGRFDAIRYRYDAAWSNVGDGTILVGRLNGNGAH